MEMADADVVINGEDDAKQQQDENNKTDISSLSPTDESFFQNLLESSETFASLLSDLVQPPSLSTSSSTVSSETAAVVDSSSASAATTTTSDQVEIRFRNHLLHLLEAVLSSSSSSSIDGALSTLGEFWTATVQLCRHWIYFHGKCYSTYLNAIAVQKLPFVLLEDVLETLTLTDAQAFWSLYLMPAFEMEQRQLQLQPEQGNKKEEQQQQMLLLSSSASNLIFLKTCNAFWKRCCTNSGGNNGESAAWAAKVLQTLSDCFPLSERSAVRVWGSRNLDTLAEFESAKEYEEQQLQQQHQQGDRAVASTASSAMNVDYNFYQSLWSLQQDFSSPFVKNVGVFLARVKSVLQVLETTAPTAASVPPNDKGDEDHAVRNSTSSTFMNNSKYLTHARLLPYQLQDPTFRAHLLTQFLIVAHHISTEAPAVGSQLEESRQRATALLSSLQSSSSSKSSSSLKSSPASSTIARNSSSTSTGTSNPELLHALEHVLTTSEPQWIQWKKNKCPDLDVKVSGKEKDAGLAAAVGEEGVPAGDRKREGGVLEGDAASRKRPRLGDTNNSDSSSLNIPQLLNLHKELPSICFPLQAPTLEKHLEDHDYLDALDPDSGIEAEYHPKNNPYFCWQALRLLPVSDFDKIRVIRGGDFENAVRHVWKRDKGIDIPGGGACADAGGGGDAGHDPSAQSSPLDQVHDEGMMEEEEVEEGDGGLLSKEEEEEHGDFEAVATTDDGKKAQARDDNGAKKSHLGRGGDDVKESKDEEEGEEGEATDYVDEEGSNHSGRMQEDHLVHDEELVGGKESASDEGEEVGEEYTGDQKEVVAPFEASENEKANLDVEDNVKGGATYRSGQSNNEDKRNVSENMVSSTSSSSKHHTMASSTPTRAKSPPRTTESSPPQNREKSPTRDYSSPHAEHTPPRDSRPVPDQSPPHNKQLLDNGGKRGPNRHPRDGPRDNRDPHRGAVSPPTISSPPQQHRRGGGGRGHALGPRGGGGGPVGRDDRDDRRRGDEHDDRGRGAGVGRRGGGGGGGPLGRDDRGPPPGRDDRGPPPGRGDRAPPGRDDRGPPPGRDDRGLPPPGRDDRGPPPPGRDDRGPPPPGRDDRGPPPPGRDDRAPLRGERGLATGREDRRPRGDRREGGGADAGGGRRGPSRERRRGRG